MSMIKYVLAWNMHTHTKCWKGKNENKENDTDTTPTIYKIDAIYFGTQAIYVRIVTFHGVNWNVWITITTNKVFGLLLIDGSQFRTYY